ncbi:amino acid adenylation domain-containing protein [Solwaraspora sp. WMMD406]|uniref:amino acid adenylation domain-containing protein n=1 Tax=Solwaraspora sp. WMMD406 TaxID=3016095 RepID=UPI002417FED3|nr:amino acid adenylation domain-containing protein [Solwaraspora sp. WMMD406]MDG4765018.1 amino acid adenylation domain-containing protein [Solwaraspora sp. WMMD406]
MPRNDGLLTVADDLVALFRRSARRHPDRTAIVHNGQPMTYAELDAAVDRVADQLGPNPGVIGVWTSRSPDTIVHLLGVLAAGGTYCPIDRAYPAERRDALLLASGARTTLPTSTAVPTVAAAVGAAPDRVSDGEYPAYILFTSGSTGVPKPVLTPRRAITASASALAALFDLTPQDRVLQFASLNWDTCFEEILPSLISGATLVFNDEAYAGSFPRLLRMVAAESITMLDLPTAFWHELVHYLVEYETTLPDSVRLVIIGGEAVSAARLADWRSLDTAGIRLINTYGCTETTLVTHAADLHGPLAAGATSGPAPIGWALPHVREDISDEGELLIAGPSVAAGYLGLPTETAARFVTRDAGDGPEVYFRTGDRVSRRPDGALSHEGRLDNQIKVRGVRVDPGEVETYIAEHPGVAATVVVGVTVANHTTLTAYVVPKVRADPPTPVDPDLFGADVLAYLRSRVPRHLIPDRITVVADLVYTPSGKVDRAGTHQRHRSTRRPRS